MNGLFKPSFGWKYDIKSKALHPRRPEKWMCRGFPIVTDKLLFQDHKDMSIKCHICWKLHMQVQGRYTNKYATYEVTSNYNHHIYTMQIAIHHTCHMCQNKYGCHPTNIYPTTLLLYSTQTLYNGTYQLKKVHGTCADLVKYYNCWKYCISEDIGIDKIMRHSKQ